MLIYYDHWSTYIKAPTLFLLAFLSMSFIAEVFAEDLPSGTPEDDAYAAKVWHYLQQNQLVGKNRIRSFPFFGKRPHGSIQEVIATEATINGHKGRLIVKHNYGAKKALTLEEVYSSKQSENYEALTIMFQREKGYDTANSDWFWAEYEANGKVFIYQNQHLSGRSRMCLGCHTPLGGKDKEILNGSSK